MRGEKSDGGDGAAEVNVEVPEVGAVHPVADEKGLCKVGEEEKEAVAGRLTAEAEDGKEAAHGDCGVCGKDEEQGGERSEQAFAFEVVGGLGLSPLFGAEVGVGTVSWINGGDGDGKTESAEAEDLAEEEGVRDSGIATEEVGDVPGEGGVGSFRVVGGRTQSTLSIEGEGRSEERSGRQGAGKSD